MINKKNIGYFFVLLFLIGSGCKDNKGITGTCPSALLAWDSLRHAINPADSNYLSVAQAYIDCMEHRLGYLHDTLYVVSQRDWLAQHHEAGQSFMQYINSAPIGIDSTRKYIYLQKIGPFNESESKIIADAATYLSIFFNTPTKITDGIALSNIPDKARRKSLFKGNEQIKSTYLLYEELAPNLPKDASVCIGFTATDLYPSEKWNYVFGQASLRHRVGIWSIYRFGQPSVNLEAYKKCLVRALKTASHETGHMYSIQHCIAYNCNMSGSNNLGELDSHSPYYCPQCLAKISWNLNINELDRMQRLEAFWSAKGFPDFAQYYQRAQKSLKR